MGIVKLKNIVGNLLLFANEINGENVTYNNYCYLHDNLTEMLDILDNKDSSLGTVDKVD